MPRTTCPVGATCGFVDAGCGLELECGRCTAPLECGVTAPNTCSLPRLRHHGFVWENPLPQGNQLFAAFALGERQVWAVGNQGTVLFWDGERSRLQDVGTDVDLRGVHGASPTEVYVVGDRGFIARFDGQRWQREPFVGTYRLNAVWASGGGRAYAAGNGGYILSRALDGTWSEMSFIGGAPSEDVLALHQLASGQLFAATTQRVFRLVGTEWTLDVALAGTRLTASLGGAALSLIYGGTLGSSSSSTLYRRAADGGWAAFGPGVTAGIDRLAVDGDDVWIAGAGGELKLLAGDDAGLRRVSLSRTVGLSALAVLRRGAVFVGGAYGTMAIAEDGGLRELFGGATTAANSVCGYAEARMFAPADLRYVYERRVSPAGVRWDAVERTVTNNMGRWLGCVATGPDQVWVVGPGTVYLRHDGGVFMNYPTGTGPETWRGVWASPDAGPYVLSNLYVYDFASSGVLQALVSPGTPTGAIMGVPGTGDFYAVGGSSTVIFRSGGSWATAQPPSSEFSRTLRSVHGARLVDGGTLFSIVGNGTAWRRTGGNPNALVTTPVPGNPLLAATFVDAQGAVWAGGETSASNPDPILLLHADGGWSQQLNPSEHAIAGMGSVGELGVFVVGAGGSILRAAAPDGG